MNSTLRKADDVTTRIVRADDRYARRALERLAAATLETLLNAIDANDSQTGRHVRRVARNALVIADALGLDPSACRAVERVALFHDIGKIHEALFDIVHEKARLTPAERREIATHPARGAEVLAPLRPFYPELPAGVLAHHEWWNGKGYPRGLRGEQIPFESRIVAIADTYDAVTHTRRYRRGSGPASAMQIIAKGRGTQFDPDLVDLVMLPPIVARFRGSDRLQKARGGTRRAHMPEPAPDVSFRWRSPSFGSGGVDASRRVD